MSIQSFTSMRTLSRQRGYSAPAPHITNKMTKNGGRIISESVSRSGKDCSDALLEGPYATTSLLCSGRGALAKPPCNIVGAGPNVVNRSR